MRETFRRSDLWCAVLGLWGAPSSPQPDAARRTGQFGFREGQLFIPSRLLTVPKPAEGPRRRKMAKSLPSRCFQDVGDLGPALRSRGNGRVVLSLFPKRSFLNMKTVKNRRPETAQNRLRDWSRSWNQKKQNGDGPSSKTATAPVVGAMVLWSVAGASWAST